MFHSSFVCVDSPVFLLTYRISRQRSLSIHFADPAVLGTSGGWTRQPRAPTMAFDSEVQVLRRNHGWNKTGRREETVRRGESFWFFYFLASLLAYIQVHSECTTSVVRKNRYIRRGSFFVDIIDVLLYSGCGCNPQNKTPKLLKGKFVSLIFFIFVFCVFNFRFGTVQAFCLAQLVRRMPFAALLAVRILSRSVGHRQGLISLLPWD